MSTFLSLIIGAIGGFLVHSITMKVSFKQRTIDNKIKVYDSIICSWVQFRNYIYSPESWQDKKLKEIDKMYGETQKFIAEVILVCEDTLLAEEINLLNEELYRHPWGNFKLEEANETIEDFKIKAFDLIAKMRNDIKSSTRFDLSDFRHIVSG